MCYVDTTTYQNNLELFSLFFLIYILFFYRITLSIFSWFTVFKSFLYMLMKGGVGKEIFKPGTVHWE